MPTCLGGKLEGVKCGGDSLGLPVDGGQMTSAAGASRMSGHGHGHGYGHDHPSWVCQASDFALRDGLRLGVPRLRDACRGMVVIPCTEVEPGIASAPGISSAFGIP